MAPVLRTKGWVEELPDDYVPSQENTWTLEETSGCECCSKTLAVALVISMFAIACIGLKTSLLTPKALSGSLLGLSAGGVLISFLSATMPNKSCSSSALIALALAVFTTCVVLSALSLQTMFSLQHLSWTVLGGGGALAFFSILQSYT